MNTKKGGLGKGLAALIPSGATPSLTTNAASIIMGDNPALTSVTVKDIPITDISPNPKQPRQVFDEENLNELVYSIKEFGLLQPIVVRKVSRETPYELVMGERRWRASKLAGLETITAIIRETKDEDLLRDALLENIHRVQLNPLEEAAAYEQLLEEFNVNQEELAIRIGKSRPAITNTIRLLKLPVNVQKRIAAGVLSAGHARALLRINDDPERIELMAKKIVAEGLSVRAVEEALQDHVKPVKRDKRKTLIDYTSSREKLADYLDTKIEIKATHDKGKLTITFSDSQDLERILSLIVKN